MPMELHTWLGAKHGRAKWLAEKLGVSKTAVSLWRANGVPVIYMPKIADLTAGDVSIEDMAIHASACRQDNAEKRSANA